MDLKTFDPQHEFGNAKFGITDRASYESTCAELGVPAHTDAEIQGNAYAFEYAEFGPAWATMGREKRVTYLVDDEYYRVMKAAAKAARATRKPAPRQTVKCDCGHIVEVGQRMNASLGTSCPDCYDRMSD